MLGATTTGTTSSSASILSSRSEIQTASVAALSPTRIRQSAVMTSLNTTSGSLACLADFTPEACLFCDQASSSLASNRVHMETLHGLSIPLEGHLSVGLETLFRYTHLVIHQYRKCLYCDVRRSSPRAIQQHMMDKRHCKFNLDVEESELLEFYDLSTMTNDDEPDRDSQREEESIKGVSMPEQLLQSGNHSSSGTATPIVRDDTTLCLPSGRIITRRSAATSLPSRPHKHHRTPSPGSPRSTIHGIETMDPSATDSQSSSPQESDDGALMTATSSSLAKQARRDKAFIIQLSNLRNTDRQALARLSASEQQVLLATAQKQMAKSNRAEKRFMGKMDGLGNQKVMERFVNDVPGGRSHRARYLVK